MRSFFIERKKYFLLAFMLVIINSIILFLWYNKITGESLKEYSYDIVNKFTYSLVSSYFNDDLVKDDNWNDILVIEKNSDNEILFVDFDLKQANILNEKMTNMFEDYVRSFEMGTVIDKKLNIKGAKNGFQINIPFFINSTYGFLSNLGPSIPIKVSFIGSVKTNIKTSVKNYGLNNSLLDIIITVTIKENIVTPINNNDYTLDYDILVDSKLIQGRVPYFYDGNLVSEKTVFKYLEWK